MATAKELEAGLPPYAPAQGAALEARVAELQAAVSALQAEREQFQQRVEEKKRRLGRFLRLVFVVIFAWWFLVPAFGERGNERTRCAGIKELTCLPFPRLDQPA